MVELVHHQAGRRMPVPWVLLVDLRELKVPQSDRQTVGVFANEAHGVVVHHVDLRMTHGQIGAIIIAQEAMRLLHLEDRHLRRLRRDGQLLVHVRDLPDVLRLLLGQVPAVELVLKTSFCKLLHKLKSSQTQRKHIKHIY